MFQLYIKCSLDTREDDNITLKLQRSVYRDKWLRIHAKPTANGCKQANQAMHKLKHLAHMQHTVNDEDSSNKLS